MVPATVTRGRRIFPVVAKAANCAPTSEDESALPLRSLAYWILTLQFTSVTRTPLTFVKITGPSSAGGVTSRTRKERSFKEEFDLHKRPGYVTTYTKGCRLNAIRAKRVARDKAQVFRCVSKKYRRSCGGCAVKGEHVELVILGQIELRKVVSCWTVSSIDTKDWTCAQETRRAGENGGVKMHRRKDQTTDLNRDRSEIGREFLRESHSNWTFAYNPMQQQVPVSPPQNGFPFPLGSPAQ